MNWGNKIVIAFICFAAFIGYMVVKAFQEDFDLVAEDYYAQEINYQQKLNKLSNAAEGNKEVIVKQVGEVIELTFPEQATGEIHFYHPSRKIFDRKYAIDLSKENVHSVMKSELVPGSYRVNITWNSDQKDFYQQSSIYIQ